MACGPPKVMKIARGRLLTRAAQYPPWSGGMRPLPSRDQSERFFTGAVRAISESQNGQNYISCDFNDNRRIAKTCHRRRLYPRTTPREPRD
jgi:hypothetical protein